MKVSIIQSSYIPWRGYFDFIDQVDLFVFYDDVQYTKSDWRNRNRIKTDKGPVWMTVPVRYGKLSKLICETPIDYAQNWTDRHLNQLRQWYGKAPFYGQYVDSFGEVLTAGHASISDLNIALCHWVMEQLGISTPTICSTELNVSGSKTEKLMQIFQATGADAYVSGSAARAYLDEDMFRERGIRLEYKSYDYPPYPQLWGEFSGDVSILDLLFNTGQDARNYLHSRKSNEVAVS